MDSSLPSEQGNKFLKSSNNDEDEATATAEIKYDEIIKTLPKVAGGWPVYNHLYLYEGFWYIYWFLTGTISAQRHFTAQPNDIFLCSSPKSGTTWLKALAFSVLTRTRFGNVSMSPLATKLPHDCVPFLEFDLSKGQARKDLQLPLVATHIPCSSLPKSIVDNKCKIVYIYRDPKDAFVSLWNVISKFVLEEDEALGLDQAFEMFCKGMSVNGPYWDHVLGYLKASLVSPDKVLVLKYEDLMIDTAGYVKKMADFMGCSFTLEEEKEGVVKEIVDFCSFENLSNLDVNKKGRHRATKASPGYENNRFFRKGKVGDWKNHLTAEMGEELDQIIQNKFSDCGLTY